MSVPSPRQSLQCIDPTKTGVRIPIVKSGSQFSVEFACRQPREVVNLTPNPFRRRQILNKIGMVPTLGRCNVVISAWNDVFELFGPQRSNLPP